MNTMERVKEFADALRSAGASEGTLVTPGGGTLTLKLGPVATSGPPVPATQHDELLCKCGHSLATEHTDAGCLQGCAVGFCLDEPDTVE